MARTVRIEYPGAVYHVMSRGDRREEIFRGDEDRELFLTTLAQMCERTGMRIHSYVLMSNHYHLLLETPEANLVAGMKWFQGAYTQRFNRRHRLCGHLFQGRYKAVPVEADGSGYFQVVSDYIHLNPVRAGILDARMPDLSSSSTGRSAAGSRPLHRGDRGSQIPSPAAALISVSGGPSSVTATFAYDARNRCVSRTLNGATTYYTYDGWSLIEEYGGTGSSPSQTYIHGAATDELLAMVTPSATHFYHQDALGSTVRITNATGAVEESYTYDVFGKVSLTDGNGNPLTSSAIGNRFLFTGREWLKDIGLYDYRNRVYSQDLGRFLQTDPIRFDAGDVNLYRYCGNDPMNGADPFGLLCLSDGQGLTNDLDNLTNNLLNNNLLPSSPPSSPPPLPPPLPPPGGSDPNTWPDRQAPHKIPRTTPVNDSYNGGSDGGGGGYLDRYLNYVNQYDINPGPWIAAAAGGVMPKSWSRATGGRGPALGSRNPLTSIPRGLGVPGAGSPWVRNGAGLIGVATVGAGFWNIGVYIGGLGAAAGWY